MAAKLLSFLRNEENLKFFSWIGGGVLAVFIVGWPVYTYFDGRGSPTPAKPAIEMPTSSGSIGIIGDINAPITNIINTPTNTVNISSAQLESLIKAAADPVVKLSAQQQTLIGDLQRQIGVSEGALRSFFRTLGEAQVPTERLPEKLSEIAQRYRDLQQQLAAVPNDDSEIAKLKSQARAALDAGDPDAADALLVKVFEAEKAALDERQLQAAATLSQRGQIALTQLRYLDAAKHFAAAAKYVPLGHETERLKYLDSEADALFYQGYAKGDHDALRTAIARRKQLLNLHPRDQAPLDWANAQLQLGNVLLWLGQWEIGTARLEQAVAAYRAALEVWTRDQQPQGWAMAQTGLGLALSGLGEQASDMAQLVEAVTAYRKALEIWTRDQQPGQWAITQANLSATLYELGKRESSAARLEEVIAISHAVLEIWTRERVPLYWAMAQRNLGDALFGLGKKTKNLAMLEEARQAFASSYGIYEQDGQTFRRRVFSKTLRELDEAIWALRN